MIDDTIGSVSAGLASLMDLEEQDAPRWGPQELGQILRHQLDAPLLFDLSAVAMSESIALEREDVAAVKSFRELFAHPRPPITLLRLTKEFAKSTESHSRRKEQLLPAEIGIVIYYAAVLSSILRHRQSITTLATEQVRAGIEWVLKQAWMDDSLRSLFEEARDSDNFRTQ